MKNYEYIIEQRIERMRVVMATSKSVMCPYCGGRGYHKHSPPVPIRDRLFAFVPCVCQGGIDRYVKTNADFLHSESRPL